MKIWVEEEGLCRFCDAGRLCEKSRRGRQICPVYKFANEMDCFHLWIAFFTGPPRFRKGYDTPDSYPWENDGAEADDVTNLAPHDPRWDKNAEVEAKIYMQLNSRKHLLMQRLEDYPIELEKLARASLR